MQKCVDMSKEEAERTYALLHKIAQSKHSHPPPNLVNDQFVLNYGLKK